MFCVESVKLRLNNILSQKPQAFTFSGQLYSGTRTNKTRDRIFSEYGSADNYAFSIIAVNDDFLTKPKADDTIIIDSVTYRVMGTEEDSAGAALKIDLANLYGRS